MHKPLNPAELLGVIHDVFEAEQQKLRRLEDIAKINTNQGRGGEVITVFSPKGGVGCTTIAANLAVALSNITKARVALVDFSLQFGDVAVLLNLHSSHGIHELMRNLDDLDSNILDDVMVKHSSGVRVLLPPPTLDLVDEVATDGMTAVIKALRRNYDYVVRGYLALDRGRYTRGDGPVQHPAADNHARGARAAQHPPPARPLPGSAPT